MFGLMSRIAAPARSAPPRKNISPGSSLAQAAAPGGLARQTVYAVALGFSTVAVGCALFGGGFGRVLAENNDAGIRTFIDSEAAKLRARVSAPPVFHAAAPAPQGAQRYKATASFERAAPGARLAPRTATRAALAKLPPFPSTVSVNASGLQQRSVCVRLCDGFYFPVATANSESDLNGHEALCSGLCPGAPTKLFVIPGGTEKIEDAVTREGKSYTALPVAFRHQGTSDNTCSCRRPNQSHASLVSLYKDFTLRRGDSVMTDKGFRVFRGARSWPYHGDDFSNLAASDIDGKSRAALGSLERASLRATRVTQTAPDAATAAKANAAKPKAQTARPANAPPDVQAVTPRRNVGPVGPQATLGTQ